MTLFTREDLIGGLRDLVQELRRAGHPTGLRIIGGGALALRHYDRRTTADIDALHVNPGDEPVAGVPTTIWVVRVKNVKGTGTFSWATCRCQLKVFDSSGAVVQNGAAKAPRTAITFPEAKAYGITFSGRIKRNGVWRTFKVSYAIRAAAPEGE